MSYYSTIKNPQTMDYNLITKKHNELMEDLDLILKYMEFDDWNEMILSIKREMKIKEILNK